MDIDVHSGMSLEQLIATAPTTAHRIAFQMLGQAARGGAIEIRHVQGPPADLSELHDKVAALTARIDAEQASVEIPDTYDDAAIRSQMAALAAKVDQLVVAYNDLAKRNAVLEHNLANHDHETIREVAA